MLKPSRLIESILRDDPDYAERKTLMKGGMEVKEFVFGDLTITSLAGLTFECRKCGTCCKNGPEADDVCVSLKKKRCAIYESRPLQCAIFPYGISSTSEHKDGKTNTIGRYEGVRTGDNEFVQYEFGLAPAFYLTLTDGCGGLNHGERTLREIGLESVRLIANWEGELVMPYMKRPESSRYEKEFRYNYEWLHGFFKRQEENADFFLFGPWNRAVREKLIGS